MLMSRKILGYVVAVLGGFGLIAASIPFFSSFAPSQKAEANRAAWNVPPVPDLALGQVTNRQISESKRQDNIDGSWSPVWGKRDILIRDNDGHYYSYRLMTWEGSVVMPRVFWGQWEGECKDFGPLVNDANLLAGSTIQCNDQDTTNNYVKEAKWSIDGKSLVKPYPDLPKLRCRDSGRGRLECY